MKQTWWWDLEQKKLGTTGLEDILGQHEYAFGT